MLVDEYASPPVTKETSVPVFVSLYHQNEHFFTAKALMMNIKCVNIIEEHNNK